MVVIGLVCSNNTIFFIPPSHYILPCPRIDCGSSTDDERCTTAVVDRLHFAFHNQIRNFIDLPFLFLLSVCSPSASSRPAHPFHPLNVFIAIAILPPSSSPSLIGTNSPSSAPGCCGRGRVLSLANSRPSDPFSSHSSV